MRGRSRLAASFLLASPALATSCTQTDGNALERPALGRRRRTEEAPSGGARSSMGRAYDGAAAVLGPELELELEASGYGDMILSGATPSSSTACCRRSAA